MTAPPITAGFLSYARHDDEYDGGRITRVRERLEAGIRFHAGHRSLVVFQDRQAIGWGQDWQKRIAQGLDGALVLFPVITPSFFTSAACLEELLAFRAREEAVGRDDLILPIYWLRTPAMEREDAAGLSADAQRAAAVLRARQFGDWRALRRTQETDPAYVDALDRLAEQATEVLGRIPPPSSRDVARAVGHASGRLGTARVR